MSDQPVRFAKLASPRLHGAVPRPRLFALIDDLRRAHSVLWINAPPGAGKTVLAASYLAERGAPCHWCQIDQGDADPATLFFFLAEAIKGTGSALPWSAPAREMGAAGLERLFFRDFYARLPPGAVLVLDNIQEFDWANAGALMESAFTEVPEGITVIALSRDAPPARLARMALGGRLGCIGWDQLRLDGAEARALAQVDDDDASQAWLDLVDGWVAGLVMLRSLREQGGAPHLPSLEGRDAVFQYFAGEIFERMAPAAQHLLMLLSCLPGISADDADQLTGDPEAARLLSALYRDRLFVERRGSAVITYHFHALFREFLQHEARLRLDAGLRRTLLARAATILDAQGRVDDAAQLFQDAGAHPALVTLLLTHAADMLDAGRGQTWRDWMSTLPPALIDQEPWMWYWHGVSLIQVTPIRARQILDRAERAFALAGDAAAQVRVLAAMIDSYDVEWADFRALPDIIERLIDALHGLDLATLDAALDLRVHARLTLALLLVAPDAPLLASTAERALRVLPQVRNPVEQLMAGAILLRHFDVVEKADSAHWLVSELNKLADDPGISPYHRVRWYRQVANWYNQDGRYDQAEQVTGSAKRIVANFGLDPLLFQFLEAHHLLGNGELDAARALLDQSRAQLSPKRKRDLVEFNMLEASWRALAGDPGGALDAAMEGIQISVDAGLPSPERARFESFVAACLALQGRFDEADHWYLQAHEHAFGYDRVLVAEARSCVEAYACAARGDDAGAAAILRAALEGHRKRQATTLFAMLPQVAALVVALALRYDIEVEHVRAIIVRQRLQAPQRHEQNWPWAVSVRTLGNFELALHGEAVTAGGKAKQRPLSLLKALVASGDGGKNQKSLALQLWPDAEDAKSALSVTVHRLRKLLDGDDTILVNAGKIGLAPTKYWSDLLAVGELCDQVERLDERAPSGEIQRLKGQLLHLYRGPFCDGDEDSWVLTVREQWRSRFLSAVSRLGQLLEEQRDWSAAHALYQRALDAEPLAETSYRGIMRCSHALGDPAAAYSAYRRCRDTLSVLLGSRPSPETERLVDVLGLRG
jgi:LuxR family transcriptional regulator, maltose regulon positive regulatory protein